MSNRFVLLTIFLLVSSAFASHFDFAHIINRRNHHDRTQHLSAGDKADLLNFVKGFLKGISEDSVFDHIKSCIAESQTFFNDVSTGIALIKTKEPAKVKQGIALLGQAVQIIPDAARDCGAAQSEIKKLIKLAREFTNPASFLYTIGKSLLINHVEVIREVTNAIAAFENKDYYNLGYWVGKAMDTIFLGFNQPLRQSVVEHINLNQNSWTAKIPSKFANMTLAEIKSKYLGSIPDFTQYPNLTVSNFQFNVSDIPTSFNSSEKWPGCIHPIRDQGQCGSCWAFGASEVLSDRFCIASNNKVDVILSPQFMVSCNTLNHGCNGGNVILAWWFLGSDGIVTESCWPYESETGEVPSCKFFTQCKDSKPKKFYKSIKTSVAQLNNPTAIQTNILQYGPVEATFTVYEDFMSYKGGIYKHTSGALLGGHAVKLIGWGQENGVNYWIAANSWASDWGMNGYFKIAFGEVQIDKGAIAGQADLTTPTQSWF